MKTVEVGTRHKSPHVLPCFNGLVVSLVDGDAVPRDLEALC